MNDDQLEIGDRLSDGVGPSLLLNNNVELVYCV